METTIKNTLATASNGKSKQKKMKLSKAGEWKRKHPEGILIIRDMKAVMK